MSDGGYCFGPMTEQTDSDGVSARQGIVTVPKKELRIG